MSKGLVATASESVRSPIFDVWDALVNPMVIKKYMFGTEVVSEWRVGSRIVWRGVWQGKSYEDKGMILRMEPNRLVEYSHFSPLSELPDVPENYHTVTIELSAREGQTLVTLSQDNNPTEEARAHSEANWTMMLRSMKKLLEERGADERRGGEQRQASGSHGQGVTHPH